MFQEIYEFPVEIYFSPTEVDIDVSSSTHLIDSEVKPCMFNIQADVVCTTYELDSEFKEVLKVREEPALRTVDNRSIDLNFNSEVEIKNYLSAKQGQMPVMDLSQGIRWIDPLNSHDLDVKVEQAKLYAEESTKQSLVSTSKAAEAMKYSESIKSAATYLENKFWFGTITEYNKLLVIDPNRIYVITT